MNEMQDEANKNSKKAVPVHFVQRDELSRDEQVWTDKGNAAAEKGEYEAAAQAFARAVELSPINARARYNLALAQQYLNDPDVLSILIRSSSMLTSIWEICIVRLGCLRSR